MQRSQLKTYPQPYQEVVGGEKINTFFREIFNPIVECFLSKICWTKNYLLVKRVFQRGLIRSIVQ